MGKPEVNKHTLKMERSDQTQDRKSGIKADILRDFRVSFFAMSRLASFPWTVSKTGLWSRVFYVTIRFIERCAKLHSNAWMYRDEWRLEYEWELKMDDNDLEMCY